MLVDTNLAQAIVLNNAIAQQFPPHYRFDTHFHRSVELLLCKSGTISFAIQGSEQILNPGQYIVIFPNIPHDTAAPGETTAQALHIHFHIKSACSLYGQQRPDGNQPFLMELILSRRPFFGAFAPLSSGRVWSVFLRSFTPRIKTVTVSCSCTVSNCFCCWAVIFWHNAKQTWICMKTAI